MRLKNKFAHLTSFLLGLSFIPLLSACQSNSASVDSKSSHSKPAGNAAKSGSSNSSEALKLANLKLNVSEASLQESSDFEYFAAGHFGDKTQYNGNRADEFGGAYAVHCRTGVPFSIEVKYGGKGIKREQALKVMERLLPENAGGVVEHDDEDLRKRDAKQAAEFFYYKNGPRTELLFADDSITDVVQVNIWTKEG